VAKADQIVGLTGLATPQLNADASQQFFEGKGFDEVIIGTVFEATYAVGDGIAGGEHDDRDVRGGAQATSDFEAINAGQHQVEDDEILGRLTGNNEPTLTIMGDRDLKALKEESAPQVASNFGFVFNNKDALHSHLK
jgi:hypothetical protein